MDVLYNSESNVSAAAIMLRPSKLSQRSVFAVLTITADLRQSSGRLWRMFITL